MRSRTASVQGLWAKVMAGEERAQEVWLRNRTRKAALLGLGMRPEQHVVAPTFIVNTALPPEVSEMLEEDGPGELPGGPTLGRGGGGASRACGGVKYGCPTRLARQRSQNLVQRAEDRPQPALRPAHHGRLTVREVPGCPPPGLPRAPRHGRLGLGEATRGRARARQRLRPLRVD